MNDALAQDIGVDRLLRILALIGMALGAWQSFQALGTPVIYQGKRWYRQPDGRLRRWYGGRARDEADLAAEEHR